MFGKILSGAWRVVKLLPVVVPIVVEAVKVLVTAVKGKKETEEKDDD